MKKYFLYLYLIIAVLLMSGCSKESESEVIKNLEKKILKSEGYVVEGTMEVINNEDKYEYQVISSYSKENNFKVNLINKNNNHEQIIIRNKDGVYVFTPSLNKSYKFESDWPYNNSQIYVLQSVLSDLTNKENRLFKKENDKFIFLTKPNYSNNNLTKEQIIINKKFDIEEIKILDNNDNIQMLLKINNIDYKPVFENDFFSINDNKVNSTINTNKNLNSIVYPMFLPNNTQLSAQEKINLDNGERVILTFSGDNPFTLIQETPTITSDLTTIPTMGEPLLITDTIGIINDNSINWTSNGVEFYVISDKLNNQQLLQVANSINTKAVGK